MNTKSCEKTSKQHSSILSLDKPLTLSELAQIVGPRLGEPRRERSTSEIIEYWMTTGFYGIKLETWVAQSARITTLKKYQDFRREVAQARKRQAIRLYDYLCTKRNQPHEFAEPELEENEENLMTLPFSYN